jgi:hypothetical protein
MNTTALTKTLRDGRTAIVTVEAIPYLHTAGTTVHIDGKESGRHLGPHHAAPQEVLDAHPGYVAAIGPLLLTANEAAQIEAVYQQVSATIPPDLTGLRESILREIDGLEQEMGLRAAERLDAGYANPFAESPEFERRIAEARKRLTAFDAEHPEIAGQARAAREAAVQHALEGRD